MATRWITMRFPAFGLPRERHRRYASERIPTQVRQVAPQWGFFGGGGFGGGGWFGSATQYGGGFWGR